jgi:hypothetical protein
VPGNKLLLKDILEPLQGIMGKGKRKSNNQSPLVTVGLEGIVNYDLESENR